MNNREFQNHLSTAVSLHRVINTKDMSKEHVEVWAKLVSTIAQPAFDVYSATHDAAGMPLAIIDEEAESKARSALAKALRPIVDYVGNVSFKGMEGEALLEVNRQMLDIVASISWKWDWDYSQEVNDIREEMDIVKNDLAIAKAWFEYYNFNGVDETLKAQKQETVNALAKKYAELDELRKAEEKKPNGKVKAKKAQDGDSNAFRVVFESTMNDFINKRHLEDYTEYTTRMKAKKAKKNARTAETRKAKKALQTQAELDKKAVAIASK